MTKGLSHVRTGSLLVAEPFLWDGNFRRSVILLTDCREDGAVGFILNKELAQRVDELPIDLPHFEVPAFHGGPVARDRLYFLHNVGNLLDGSIQICNGVWFGGDFEQLRFLISSQLIEEKHIRFFVGYAGWSEGQLKDEIETGSWIVADMDSNYVFNTPPELLWKRVLQNKGAAFSIIADMPDDNVVN